MSARSASAFCVRSAASPVSQASTNAVAATGSVPRREACPSATLHAPAHHRGHRGRADLRSRGSRCARADACREIRAEPGRVLAVVEERRIAAPVLGAHAGHELGVLRAPGRSGRRARRGPWRGGSGQDPGEHPVRELAEEARLARHPGLDEEIEGVALAERRAQRRGERGPAVPAAARATPSRCLQAHATAATTVLASGLSPQARAQPRRHVAQPREPVLERRRRVARRARSESRPTCEVGGFAPAGDPAEEREGHGGGKRVGEGRARIIVGFREAPRHRDRSRSQSPPRRPGRPGRPRRLSRRGRERRSTSTAPRTRTTATSPPTWRCSSPSAWA